MVIYLLQNLFAQALSFATKIHGDKKCLGTRQIFSEEDEVQKSGKVFKKYNMGEYQWRSFYEVQSIAVSFGRGLRGLGQEALNNVVIFADTRAEWLIAAHGCFNQNFPIVTIYATLGDDGVAHGKLILLIWSDFIQDTNSFFSQSTGVNETEAKIIITTSELLPKFKKLLAQLPKVQTIIYMEDQLQETKTDGYKEGVRILSFNEVVNLGRSSSVIASPPSPDDIAIIMYTSGSTGAPKGNLIFFFFITIAIQISWLELFMERMLSRCFIARKCSYFEKALTSFTTIFNI